jgi:hypothetical protein
MGYKLENRPSAGISQWETTMRISAPVISALFLLTAPALAQNAGPPAPPVAGVIQSFDGKTLTVKANDGSTVAAAVASDSRILKVEPRTLADIKPGSFIASGGTKGPDGKIHANEIRIFSAPGGEGQYPMSQPGQVMTNATVKQVMTDATVKQVGSAGGVPLIKLSFHGAGAPGSANCTGHATVATGGAATGCVGETEFDVPANVNVVAWVPSDASVLKPGAKANMAVTKTPDGKTVVGRVVVTPQ